MTAAVTTPEAVDRGPGVALASWARRNTWTLALLGLLAVLLVFTKLVQPS